MAWEENELTGALSARLKGSVNIEDQQGAWTLWLPAVAFSGNAVISRHQVTTREWWKTCHERFELYVSQLVLDEAGSGDPEVACLSCC